MDLSNSKDLEFYAIQGYKNKFCIGYAEFKEDLDSARQINRMITQKTNNLLLLLNKIICFFNVFENSRATNILLYRCKRENYSFILTILYFLSYLDLKTSDRFLLDSNLLNKLEQL